MTGQQPSKSYETSVQTRVDQRPVVHIGYSKTGTSWFQKSFYPAVTSHRFIDPELAREALLGPNGLAFEVDRARDLILGAAAGVPPLLSDERLSGSILAGGLHGMVAPEVARRIKAVFPDARIVIGIRAQPGMLAACYSQYVKDGGTFGVQRYLFPDSYFFAASKYRSQAPRFDLAVFEYQRLIGLYCSMFGKENVHVFLFEQFRAGPLACVRNLAEDLGLTFDEIRVSEDIINPALNRGALRLTRFFNLFTARRTRDKWHIIHVPGLFSMRKRLHRHLQVIFRRRTSGEQLLGTATLCWVNARYARANGELSQLLGVDLGAFGYPVLPPEKHAPSPLPCWRTLRST